MENEEEIEDKEIEDNEIEDNEIEDNDLNNGENEIESNELSLELGDIIEITAPTNPDIHEMTAIITYINHEKMAVTNISNMRHYQLNIDENGAFTDESITDVGLLNRNDLKGYARQNDLLPKTWVTIHFGGEIPTTITGEITNLEEDMIEITTYPELHVIYIDFEYKGIPENIPIDTITIREKPASIQVGSLSQFVGEDEEVTMTFIESGESIIRVPENAKIDENIAEILNDLYVESNAIIFGEKLETIAQYVEVPEHEKRFGIDMQTNDFMDELLSNIPNNQRTKSVLSNIHLLIERFKQLRQHFSKFDENENIYESKIVGTNYKPLVEKIHSINTRLQWLIPVVDTRKKIYDINVEIDTDDVIQEKSEENLRKIENTQLEYVKNVSQNRTMTYSSVNNIIQNNMQSFETPFASEKHLVSKDVLVDLDVIVDNLGDFFSTVVKNDSIARNKYVIQRYNLGLTKMDEQIMKNGKKVYKRIPMTSSDKITIKSLIMLPAPIMHYSKLDLPTTNILEKANIHHSTLQLFKLFKKNTDIIPHIIDDLKVEFDYDQMEKDTPHQFLSGFHQFILSDDAQYDDDKFHDFLETIVPKTRILIRLMRKYIKDKLSFVDVVQYLEPFMVYPSDITYKQYNEIRFFIKERIKQIKTDYVKNSNEYSIIRNFKYQVAPITQFILRMFSGKPEFIEIIADSYNIDVKTMALMGNQIKKEAVLSAQEILFQMLQTDNCTLHNSLLTSLLISLMTPNNLMNILSKPAVEEMSDLEKIKPTDCHRRYLAKRYTSLKEMQKDNNVPEIFYDKEMDDTPYEIMKKYEKDQKRILPENFVEFLAENLIEKHDCPPEIAVELATTLIHKKKIVSDGEYAILEIRPQLSESVDQNALSESDRKAIQIESDVRKKTQYYRRLKNNWIHDDTIEDEAFLDTSALFCNISSNCYKNSNNNICEPTGDAAARLKQLSHKKMVDEFDKRYIIDIEELEKMLEKDIEYNRKMLHNMKFLREIQSQKANNLANELGKLASKTDDLIVSPNLKLRDLILSQDDFSKKQFDIIHFTERYCREPMTSELEENQFWKYCLETNTKLIPMFLYELAKEFIYDGDYAKRQNEFCHSIGVLSDDGDAFVDKHSGFVIRKIDFSSEEGFDESGFKVTTHSIMEKDLGTVISEILNKPNKKEERVFDSVDSETIYNIFSVICSNIDIQIDGVEEFVLKTSIELMGKVIVKESTYQERSAKQFKEKGKAMQPYDIYRKETLILLVASILLVRVQIAIPSFKTNKTFPGCIRSFSGYPFDGGSEDMTGIQYIACVLDKTKSSIPPWDAIAKLKAPELAKRMKTIIESYILKRGDINELYVQKREYILLHPESMSVEEHSISKWLHFLPPVVKTTVLKSLRNVGSDFNKDLIDTMRKGHYDQHQYYNVLKSKAVQFGYGVMESINTIVNNKDLLLKTSTLLPFMENACCNENTADSNAIQYFINEDETIKHHISAVSKMSLMLRNMRELSTASMLYHPIFTGIKYPTIAIHNLPENIYFAMIKYCNFDRDLPVPDEYKTICSEKPANYNKYWTIEEKIEFLKKNGKHYTVGNLHQLMKIVNEHNLVTFDAKTKFSRIDTMTDIVAAMDRENSTVIEDKMREYLRIVFENYNPAVMTEVDSVDVENLINNVHSATENLYQKIMTFLQKYGKLSDTDYSNVNDFLFNLSKWSKMGHEGLGDLYYDEELYAVTQYIQNAILSMSKVYPTILLNLADHNRVPAHWGFSKGDATTKKIETFVQKYYESIEQFKNDKVVSRLLMEISKRLANLNLFAQNIPIITPIKKDGHTYNALFDKETTYLLFVYCFYAVINEYIDCTNDTDLLRADIEEFKQIRRENIAENRNPSNHISAQFVSLDDNLADHENNLQEYKVKVGNEEELKERVCQLLLGILEIEEKNKKTINFSYDDIIHHVRRSKTKEKNSIIGELGKLSIEARRVEEVLKKYKIGRWNVGQQKGLVQYDELTNDRETKDMVGQMLQDIEFGTVDVMSEMMIDTYDIAELQNNEDEVDVEDLENIDNDAEKEYDEEGVDFRNYKGDDNDGQYYEEDMGDDAFGYEE